MGLCMSDMRGLSPRLKTAAMFAWATLRSMRQRAMLALLGIAIGVAAVVTLVALGQGLERQAQDDFKQMGTQVMDVSLTDPDSMLVKSKTPSPHCQRLRWSAPKCHFHARMWHHSTAWSAQCNPTSPTYWA